MHPDFHTGDDAPTRATPSGRCGALNEAWAVLGDDDRRRVYDQGLERPAAAPRSGAPGHPAPPSPDFVPYIDDDTDYSALLDEAGPGNGATVPRAAQLAPVVLFGRVGLRLLGRPGHGPDRGLRGGGRQPGAVRPRRSS